MDCPNCGAANEPGSVYCYRCGTVLQPTGAQRPATGQTVDLNRGGPTPPGQDVWAPERDERQAQSFDQPSFAPPSLPAAPSDPAGGARVYSVPSGNPPPPYVVTSAPTMTQTSNLAVLSLILGILSWIFLPFIAGIGAVITGHMARRELRDAGGRLTGDGLATAGIVLGYINIAIMSLGIVFFCLVLSGLAAGFS